MEISMLLKKAAMVMVRIKRKADSIPANDKDLIIINVSILFILNNIVH